MKIVAALVVGVLSLCGIALGQSSPSTTPAQPAEPGGGRSSPMLRPDPTANLRPKPVATIFNPNVNVKEAIDAAIARGGPERRRVLVVWGDNKSRWAIRWQEVMGAPDSQRLTRYHYELVNADISPEGFGAINLALAKSFGADFTLTPNMKPYLTVIETVGEKKGTAILNRSSEGLEKPRSSKIDGDYYALRVQDFLAEHRLPGLVTSEQLAAADERAKIRGVPLMVFFLDLEDAWCTRFDSWLKRPDVAGSPAGTDAKRGVLGERFEVLSVDLLRWQNAATTYSELGGDAAEAAPWYVILGADGKRIAPDKDKGEIDYGFPTGDEVPKFLAMLRRVQPALTESEARQLASTLEGMIHASGK